MRREDVLIVGGGPAGCAAAIALGLAGRSALVLERHVETPDALCGGFLSWSTVERLKALDVDPESLGAHPIDTVRLFTRGAEAEAPLPHRSWSLSRRTLDTALQRAAINAGARFERGARVIALNAGEVTLGGGDRIAARHIVLATGKHDLRGVGRAHDVDDPYLGLRWRLPKDPDRHSRIGDAVELHLFAGGYVGIGMQEDGVANVCLAARRSVLARADGNPADMLRRLALENPALGVRVADADSCAAQAIANVPYGWIAHEPVHGALRIGDQGSVIPSLAGEGIAMALASGTHAARALLAGGSPSRFQQEWSARAARPVRVAGGVARIGTRGTGAAMVRAVRIAPALAGLAARASRIGRG